MVSTYIPELKEITDAVPFAVFFDGKNDLNEMVAVVNTNGSVIRIAKRPANEREILRASFLLKRIAILGRKKQEALKVDLAKPEAEIGSRLMRAIHFNPVDWSVFCPYASPAFKHNFSERHARTQKFFFPSPLQHLRLGIAHTQTSLLTFQTISFALVWKSVFQEFDRAYSYLEDEPLKTWIKRKNTAAVIGRLTYLNNDPEENGILVFPNKYQRIKAAASDSTRIFKIYYMDYGVIVRISIEYSVSNDFTFNPVDYANHHISAIHLNVDNANGSLIQINTERNVISSKAAVQYLIHISVKKDAGLPQVYSGRNGIVVPIVFHLIGGFGNCVPLDSAGILGDSIATAISVGCPPSTDLVFDWVSTLRSINFRDNKAHYGIRPEECYSEEPFCFFVKYPLILHFHLFDESKQNYFNFSGKYIMRIVAGGYSRDDLRPYSEEEQQAFNVPGVSDVSLIWNEWDRKHHKKVEQTEVSKVKGVGRNDSREIVLQAGVSSIQWACHTLSPCARITPRRTMESVYYFKLFISNRGVDNDTLCLFEKEFLILLYGFPPSTEIQLITTVVFYILMLALVYFAYFCLRDNKKVWKASKSKLYGWYQITLDALPRKWITPEDAEVEETEAEKQKRRDDIIMSLQGHLNVPRIIHKPVADKHTGVHDSIVTGAVEKATEGDEAGKLTRVPSQAENPSAMSILSSASGGSSIMVLNPVIGRPAAATWTDLVYEQMISRRLAAIIERNKQNQNELKQKTSKKSTSNS